ncbi:FAD/NAD(P)-binding domain-containing protein [Ceratobasidium sp. AG-I]|nr:FAD/NAD(P)-binding domain-containing protein [Ceratobasidium sp. AG-I]
MQKHYDTVVVGGGPIGLSTAYECAKAGKKVLVLEKSIYFNQSGSSGDIVRMFRTAYTEGFMADLAAKAMLLWDQLENEAGEKLRLMTGLLNFGDPKYDSGIPEGTLKGPKKNLDAHKMRYKELTRDQLEEGFPFKELPENWEAMDMPDNGCINVTLLLRKLYDMSKALGVDLVQYADVKKISPDPSAEDKWLVSGLLGSSKGDSIAPEIFEVSTTKIAITPGAYVNHVLWPSFGFKLDINIWEMVSAYYAIDPKVEFPKMWFQFANDSTNAAGKVVSNLFYGFPSVPWGIPNVARIAVDAPRRIISDPDHRSPSGVDAEDLEHTRQFVIKHIVGAGPNPTPVFTNECLQTNVSDNMFVLDFIPDELLPGAGPARSRSIAVFTAGWAMKFVPLLGIVLKQLLVDGAVDGYDITPFKMTRTGKDGEPLIVKGEKLSIDSHAPTSQHC